jgi:hypothetical protein
MALPNFLCIGAQKGGTTTVHHLLRAHPDVFVPANKELHFFDRDDHYKRGVLFYENGFAGWRGEPAIGECTPAYLFTEPAAQRALELLGRRTRILAVLRQPVTRAWSHYLMNYRTFLEDRTFEEALQAEGPQTDRTWAYLARGRYAHQLERWRDRFDDLCVMIRETDLGEDLSGAASQLFGFLGVRTDVAVPSSLWANPARTSQAAIVEHAKLGTVVQLHSPPSEPRNLLRPSSATVAAVGRWLANQPTSTVLAPERVAALTTRYFSDEIERLQALLERDLSAWHPPP